MPINKTSITASQRLNAVIQTFSAISGQPQLKDGLIYHKFISGKKIKSLWDSDARAKLREERQAYKDWIENSLVTEYRLDGLHAIKLNGAHGLSGKKGVTLRAQAAVAKAFEDLQIRQLMESGKVEQKVLTEILVQTRRLVGDLDAHASAEDRIHVAKSYLVERLLIDLMPDLPEEKAGLLRFMCRNLHNTQYCADPDHSVIEGMKELLWKVEFDGILGLMGDTKLRALDAIVNKKREDASPSI